MLLHPTCWRLTISETNAKNDIIMMCASAAKDSNPNDANGVADAEKGIQQNHPIQGTFNFSLSKDKVNQTSISDVDQN